MRSFAVLLALVSMASCSSAGDSTGNAADAPDVRVENDGVGGEGRSAACKSQADCPDGYCSLLLGECVECTVDEHCKEGATCMSGTCVEGLVCTPGEWTCKTEGAVQCNSVGTAWTEAESCDDGVECTVDSCVGGSGCLHSPDDALCQDESDCTADACEPETGCIHEPLPECGGKGGLADPSPASLSFPPTVPGQTPPTKNVLISNAGLDNLTLFKAEVEDPGPVFYLVEPPDALVSKLVYDPPVVIPPGEGASVTLAFQPDQTGEFNGTLTLFTSDPSKEGGVLIVPLIGKGVADNCIAATPAELVFGPREVGVLHTLDVKLSNCGDGLVPIYSLEFEQGSSPEIELVAALTAPFDLDVGQTTTITMGVTPSEPGKSYSAKLIVKNGSPKTPQLGIPVTAEGSTGTAVCPIAQIQYTGGDIVHPQTPLALSAQGSYGLSAPVAGWSWSVEGPAGAYPALTPSANVMEVQLVPAVCGQYLVHLSVTDSQGHKSCNTASTVIKATPKQDLYVELLWDTPGDTNQADSGLGKGADLDLHLASALAEGPDLDGDGTPDGWFDPVLDCHAGNPTPKWGSADPQVKDDPSLLAADNDGAGPEAVAIQTPAEGLYRIGVHYRNDYGFGTSQARLAVYGNEGMVGVTAPVGLVPGDLWYAMDVQVSPVSIVAAEVFGPLGQRIIAANYPAPK